MANRQLDSELALVSLREITSENIKAGTFYQKRGFVYTSEILNGCDHVMRIQLSRDGTPAQCQEGKA